LRRGISNISVGQVTRFNPLSLYWLASQRVHF
jgi:hypothetical protein